MAIIKVERNTYTAEPLYQWDRNQTLEIYGLSLPRVPEVHFTNNAMGSAIVRQATMDSAGVLTVSVPNGLLQKPYTINAHICVYKGATFETLYTIKIGVKPRVQPADYTIEDDGDVYSFNELSNKINQVAAAMEAGLREVREKISESTNTLDSTLSEEGKAADAGAVGDALATMQALLAGDVLWENEAPTEGFPGQTLLLDLSAYKRFDIVFNSAVASNIAGHDTIFLAHALEKDMTWSCVPGNTARSITISDTGIVFGDAGNASAYVPIKIVGYKY